MPHPFVRAMKPLDTGWFPETALAVFVMWGVMMVAIMLCSTAPMIPAFEFVQRAEENAQHGRT